VSPYYRSLWGEHLHHGFWIRGDQSKEKAQLQLIEHLAQVTRIKPGSDILDIGCGFGASSLYLAKNHNAEVTGITNSSVQVQMATTSAAREQLDASFLLMDAEAMDFQKQFDLLWSVESISHYEHRKEFFTSAAKLLKPGGSSRSQTGSRKTISRANRPNNLSIRSKKACWWICRSWMSMNIS
jgi:tocopherol O-methyltransferase